MAGRNIGLTIQDTHGNLFADVYLPKPIYDAMVADASKTGISLGDWVKDAIKQCVRTAHAGIKASGFAEGGGQVKTSLRSSPQKKAGLTPVTVAPLMEPDLQAEVGNWDAVQLTHFAEKLDRWAKQMRAQVAFLACRQIQGN